MNRNIWYVLLLIFYGMPSFSQHKGINFQAVLRTPSKTYPSVSGLTATVQILTPDNCVLREEQHSNINISNGYINLVIGGANSIASGGYNPNPVLSLTDVFDNSTNRTGLTCVNGDGSVSLSNQTYNPLSSHARKMRLRINIPGEGMVIADFNMRSVPFSENSEMLDGKRKADFIQVDNNYNVNQTSLNNFFGHANYANIGNILNGTYNAPTATSASTATTATNVSGTVAIANGGTGATTQVDAANALLPSQATHAGQYLTTDGTNVSWSAAAGGASGSAGGDLTGTYPNPTLAVSGVTAGTYGAANKTISSVQVDAKGRITNITDSLISLNGNQITAGTIGTGFGGTGLSTLGTANQILGINNTADAYEFKTITAGTGISISHGANSITINSTASNGSVTNVSSANADIGVASGTSTPVLTLNSGTGADQILKLNGSAEIPAVSGVNLTNLNATNLSFGTVPYARLPVGVLANTVAAGNDPRFTDSRTPMGSAGGDLSGTYPNPTVSQLQGRAVANTLPTDGQALLWDDVNTTWKPQYVRMQDIRTSWGGTQMIPSSACATNEAMVWNVITDRFICQGISINASAITAGIIDSARLPSSATYWSAATGGINYAGGNVGVGTTAPATKLDVDGSVRVGADSTACSTANSGAIRYNGGNVEYCNSTAWVTFAASGAGITSLNGLTGNTQNFAIGTSGTGPAFSSVTNTHTLNIPLASGAGVTAGLLSKSDYDAFNAKLGTATSFSGDVSGNYNSTSVDKIKGTAVSATNPSSAQFLVYDGTTQYAPVSMSGDTTISATGAVTIANSAINSAKILDGSVATVDIADSAITNAKMADMPANTLKGNVTGSSAAPTDVAISSLQGITSSTFAAGNDSRITGALQTSGGAMTGMLTLATGTTTLSPLRIPSGTLVTTPVSGNIESDGSDLYWTNTTPTRQKIMSYSGTPSNGQLLIGNGSGFSLANITQGSGITITNSAGGITISATGSGGTVTSVSSANTDINVATGTSTPVLTLNSGTGADQIVKLDGTAKLPAVDASQLTNLQASQIPNLDAAKITTGTLPVARGGTGQSSYTDGQLLIGNSSGNTLTKATLSAGAGISITNGNGSITIANTGLTDSSTFSGDVSGTSSTTSVDKIKGKAVSATAPASGQFLVYDGTTQYVPVSVSGDATMSNTGALTLKNTGTAGTYFKVTTDAQGRVISGANLASGDITTALGYTPLNKAGDVMSGTLGIYTTASDPAGLVAGDKGKIWYNSTSNQLKYWDGSAAQSLGVAGAGLTSLNGQTGSTQTFAIPGTSGTAPNWSSSSNAHTLSIPMASTAGVTAGLISKTDYDAFNAKLGTSTTFSGDVSGTYDATSVDKIKGKIVSPVAYSAGQVLRYDGTNWVNAAINAATDLSGIVSVANGGTGANSLGAGNILIGGGTSAVSSLAAASAGNIVYATGIATWGSGTPDTAGLVDKASTQTISGAKAFSNYIQMNAQNTVRFADADSSNYVAFRSPATVAADVTWTLPAADGTSGQVLKTDGAGNLSWVSASTGTVTGVSSANADIGVATGTTTPVLTLNSGTAGGAGDANKIAKLDGSGLLPTGMIPNLDAAKMTTGTLPIARGGTNSATALINNRIMASSGGAIVEAAAITANKALISDANGIPTHSLVTNTELSYLSGVTSAIQTQLNSKTSSSGWTNFSVMGVNSSGALTAIPGTVNGSILNYTASGPAWTTASFPTSTTANQLLYSSANNVVGGLASANNAILTTNGSGVPSWSVLSNDSFTQYALLAGRSTGQTINGGTAASEKLILDSTAHATKGYVLINPTGGNVGIGTTTPGALLDVGLAGTTLGTLRLEGNTSGYVQIQPAATAGSWTMTLPANAGTNGYILTTNGSGVTSWVANSGATPSLSSLTAATATNTIANANFAQAWNWDTLTTQTGLSMGSTSMTTGSLLSLTDSFNSATSTGSVLKLTASGASSAAVPLSITNGGTGYSIDAAATGTGTKNTFRLQNTVTAANNSGVGMIFSANRTTGGLTDVAGVAGVITDISSGAYKGALTFSTANNASPTEAMRIDSSGNVGIGITNPNAPLTVTKDGTLVNGTMYAVAAFDNSAYSKGIFLGYDTTGSIGIVGSDSGAGASILAFTTRNSSSTSVERMRIDGSGNVGIGTTSPGSLLDVGLAGTTLGTMRLEGNTSGYVQIQPAAAAGSWTMTLPANAGTNGYVLTTNGSGVTSWTAPSGGASALSSVTAATASNTIANANFAQTWNWDTLTTGVGMTLGSSSITTGALLKLSESGIGSTSTDGLLMVNGTGATNGAQKQSPRLHFSGNGYKTSGPAGSKPIDWIMEAIPVQGTSAPTSYLNIASSINGSAYANTMALTSDGNVGIGTTSPKTALHLKTGTGSQTQLVIEPNSGGANLSFNNYWDGANDKRITGNSAFSFYHDTYAEKLHLLYAAGGTANTAITFADGLILDTSGNVGIGTDSPGNKLEIDNPTTQLRLRHDANYYSDFANDNINAIGPSQNFSIQINSSIKMNILDNGNVGIGTASPGAPLHVLTTDDGTYGGSLIENSNSAQYAAFSAKNDVGNTIQLGIYGSANATPNKAFFYAGAGASSLGFFINSAEQMTLLQNGNVGIGTTSPSDLLYLKTTSSRAYIVMDKQDNTAESGFLFNTNGTAKWIMYTDDTTPNAGDAGDLKIQGVLAGEDDGHPRIHLPSVNKNIILGESGGYIGIGVTSPTYQLQLSSDSAAKPGTSTWTIASDERLKDIRAPFDRGLASIEGIHPIYFSYKKNNPLDLPSEKEYVGIKAQDALKVVPEAVSQDDKGYYHVTNDAIIWTVLNAVKELYHKWLDDSSLKDRQIASKADRDEVENIKLDNAIKDREIKSLQQENAQIKQQNAEIKERLERIEKMLQSK